MSEPHGAMSEVLPAYAWQQPAETAAPDAAAAGSAIHAEVVGVAALAGLVAPWLDLLARADAPNVFMDPDWVRAAAAAAPRTRFATVVAWDGRGAGRRLIGLWAFAIGRPHRSILPVPALLAPPTGHGFLAGPVVDRLCPDAALEALLDAIASARGLPKIISLEALAADGPIFAALGRVLARRGVRPAVFEERQRPRLVTALAGKAYLEAALSSGNRKKLRQHRRRLGEAGALASRVATGPAAVRAGLEDFLAVEASGWKGREGTAILGRPAEAAFARAAIAALAERGDASVHGLYLGDRPVSLQVLLRAGGTAFTWKTAYDEAFHDFSPGTLLFEDYTAALCDDPSVTAVDSCSFDAGGLMGSWTERQPVADLMIDARRGGSLLFRALAAFQRQYRNARASAKRSYLRLRARKR